MAGSAVKSVSCALTPTSAGRTTTSAPRRSEASVIPLCNDENRAAPATHRAMANAMMAKVTKLCPSRLDTFFQAR